MSRRKTIEEVREAFANRGCQLLSETYVNAFEPLDYVARCGHTTKIKWYMFNHGEGTVCRACSYKERGERRKMPIEKIAEIFEGKGCKLLSTECRDEYDKLEFVAGCGHVHRSSFNNIQQGRGLICPVCSSTHDSENKVWEILKAHFPGAIREYRLEKKRGAQRIDFFIPERKLAIEYNGGQHYRFSPPFHRTMEDFLEQQRRDENKRIWCESHGITLKVIDGRKVHGDGITEKSVLDFVLG